MQLLLDEHISPALVARLAEIGVYAQSVPHVGLAGRPDREIWQFAIEHGFVVVTTNARDSWNSSTSIFILGSLSSAKAASAAKNSGNVFGL